PGQETLEQYAITSSVGYSTLAWQTGQRSGRLNFRSLPVRRSRTGPSTCGITSPARVTSTQSPSRMSFASIKSKLCSVTVETVTPPISTGSRTAYGLSDPVRPTLILISRSLLPGTPAPNFRATAERGPRSPPAPRRGWGRTGVAFTTPRRARTAGLGAGGPRAPAPAVRGARAGGAPARSRCSFSFPKRDLEI